MRFQQKFTLGALTLPLLWGIYCLYSGQYGAAGSALLTVLAIVALDLLHKRHPWLTTGVYCTALAFILLSVFAGKSLQFYTRVPHWDKLLHFLSGILLYFIGVRLCIKFDSQANTVLQKYFGLLFAVAAAGVWELYEFTGDLLFSLNAQNGSLSDTMTDILAGSLSALLTLWTTKKPSSKKR